MKIRTSLRNILGFNFILVALLPIVVIGIMAHRILTTSMKQEITSKNFLLATSIASEVERFLEEPLAILVHVREIVEQTELISEQDLNTYLQTVLKHGHVFETIMILDEAGIVRYLAPYSQDFIHTDMSGQNFFHKTKKSESPYWSPTFLFAQTGQPTLTLSIPMQQGIITGNLNLEALDSIVDNMNIDAQGYAVIADRNGAILAHPNHKFVSQRFNLRDILPLQREVSEREGTFNYRFEGEFQLGSVVIVSQTGWMVGIIQSTDDAFAPIIHIRNTLIAGMTMAIALAVLMALFSVKVILRPLSQLTESARRLAQGDYQRIRQTQPYTEVEELARDFNVMLESIKTREEKVRRLTIQLEQRVQKRTRELESANKDLRHFMYAASHDLKTPLRGISQIAFWLVEDYGDAFDDEGRDMVEMLINRVRRLDMLIEGILLYARVGRVEGKYEQIDLHTLVTRIVDALAPPETIRIEISRDLPILKGDESQLTQVFHHLLQNAIIFLHKPDGHIRVLCHDEGEMWAFSIVDNGPGIAPKYHEVIFQIFQTLQTHDEHESVGIGLSLVKRIIESYNGQIRVESSEGQGSTFLFTLPKDRIPPQASQVVPALDHDDLFDLWD